jgi:hypothetical protein
MHFPYAPAVLGLGALGKIAPYDWMNSISKNSKTYNPPHKLRRIFTTLSMRAGMNLFLLEGLMGHSSLEMTRRYVEMLDEDLIKAHKERDNPNPPPIVCQICGKSGHVERFCPNARKMGFINRDEN